METGLDVTNTPVYLPIRVWPTIDRAAWEGLFADGDVLVGAGPARHWAPATRRTNRQHYARWLSWLTTSIAGLDERAEPWDRVTPETVEAYARSLMCRVAPCTVASALIGLKVIMKAMRPELPWRWLMDLSNRLNHWATPLVDRRMAMQPADQIFAAARAELDRLLTTRLTRRIDRVAYRDTLIVLLLAACPIRLRNLTGIQIGVHLIDQQGHWMLRFAEHETKNRQRLAFDLPRELTPYMAIYLARIRPSFGAEPANTALWLGFEGGGLSAHSIYGRIVLVTRRLFGAPINPHLFRSCAATSLVLMAPHKARLAASLLGHRYFRTTEQHYIKAGQIEASRSIHAALSRIRARKPSENRS